MAKRDGRRIDREATNQAGMDAAIRDLRLHLETMLRYHPNFHGSLRLELRLLNGVLDRYIVGDDRSEIHPPHHV